MTLLPRILAGLSLLLATLALLPMPYWPLWELRYAAIESRALPVLLGLLGAALALRAGDRAWAVAGLGGVLLAGVPLVAALRFAASAGDPISLRAYVMGYSTPNVQISRDQVLRPDRPDLVADVYRGGAPWVMVIHGGSWHRGDKGEVSHMSKRLAAAGYTVFDLRYRLAPEHPFPAAIQDVLTALCSVQTEAGKWGIDPARGAVLGRSAGGHLAMLAANAPTAVRPECPGSPPPLRAVVSLYGPADLVWSYGHPNTPDVLGTPEILQNFLGGTPDQVHENYVLASPSLQVSANSPPALLIHGANDALVRPDHVGFMAAAMTEAGRPVHAVVIPSADHGFDVRAGGTGEQIASDEIFRFLGTWLKP